MKPSMIRWKIVPGYRGPSCCEPSRGSVHVVDPVARPTKFSTVLGACSGMSCTVNEPLFVTKVAVDMVVLPIWMSRLAYRAWWFAKVVPRRADNHRDGTDTRARLAQRRRRLRTGGRRSIRARGHRHGRARLRRRASKGLALALTTS